MHLNRLLLLKAALQIASVTALFTLEAQQVQHDMVPEVSVLQDPAITQNSSTAPNETAFAPYLAPIVVEGNKFFNSRSGEQFFIKGIAYQPSRIAGDEVFTLNGAKFIDPMSEPKICLRDLPYLKRLGVNTVRIYSFDSEKDHDVCFDAFNKAGIYVIADLSEPDISVVREAPTWDVVIYERYTKVIDSLHKYDNLLGFFAGNEVTNDKFNTDASPFVKSSIIDMKKYIKTNGYRQIPVGYSTNDDAETRNNLADYFACGEEYADFYGINMYEWCGYSTYYASGYRERTEEFRNYPIPVFFSEFGCNVKRPRPFTEVEALYSRLMTDVWSGGIAYMYFEEPNQYGVVQVANGELKELSDFASLEEQFAKANPVGTTLPYAKEKANIQSSRTCPGQDTLWEASVAMPQTPDSGKCTCMEISTECSLKSFVKENELKAIFDYACGLIDCGPIKGDGKNGVYGEFSDCSARQKANYVINEVYKQGGSQKQDCDFDGVATLNTRVISQQQLSYMKTNSGQSCADVLSAHELKKQQRLYFKESTINNTNETHKSDGLPQSNRASQMTFYANIFQSVGLATVLLVSLTVIL